MVVGDFPVIHAVSVEHRVFQTGSLYSKNRMGFQSGNTLGHLVKHVFRDETGAGTRIAQHLFFVKGLCQRQRPFSRESEPAVGILLQSGQVIQQWRLLACILTLYLVHRNRSGRCHGGKYLLCLFLGVVALLGEYGERLAVLCRGDFQLMVGLRNEIPVLQIA